MDEIVLSIQRLYPRIFHACHVRHTRRRSTAFELSEKEASLLAHLDPVDGATARDLGIHMGVGAPAMSASIKRLEALGYVERSPSTGDKREITVRITEKGTRSLASASVLDTGRLTALVERLTPSQQRAAVRGLALLAQAAAATNQEKRRR